MATLGVSIDYSNICKNYNTMYLDRDNDDIGTITCMKSILKWMKEFLEDFIQQFQFNIYEIHSDQVLRVEEVASKRFLFFSLEKGITLQDFLVQKEFIKYNDLNNFSLNNKEGLLIKNDEDGEGVYFYFNEDSKISPWIKDRLQDFTLDNAPLLSIN